MAQRRSIPVYTQILIAFSVIAVISFLIIGSRDGRSEDAAISSTSTTAQVETTEAKVTTTPVTTSVTIATTIDDPVTTIATTSTTAPVTTSTSPQPLETSPLTGLVIAPENNSGYDRDLFLHWIDQDGDGCDTRREVLIAESLEPVQIGAGCTVLSGRWYSVYDGHEETDPSTLDIDHVVALSEAWGSGANAWTPQRRRDFANDLSDPRSLIAVTSSSNRSKSDDDPAEWLPPVLVYRCEYVRNWVAVKLTWGLSADSAEHAAIERVLATC